MYSNKRNRSPKNTTVQLGTKRTDQCLIMRKKILKEMRGRRWHPCGRPFWEINFHPAWILVSSRAGSKDICPATAGSVTVWVQTPQEPELNSYQQNFEQKGQPLRKNMASGTLINIKWKEINMEALLQAERNRRVLNELSFFSMHT